MGKKKKEVGRDRPVSRREGTVECNNEGKMDEKQSFVVILFS